MYNIKSLLQKQPVAISATIIAILNLGQSFGVFTITADQLAQINTALVLGLGLLTWSQVTPTVTADANEAAAFAEGLATPTPEE